MILTDGTIIDNSTISTNERIFLLETYDEDIVICNLNIAYKLVKEGKIKKAQHLWGSNFKVISKIDILKMSLK